MRQLELLANALAFRLEILGVFTPVAMSPNSDAVCGDHFLQEDFEGLWAFTSTDCNTSKSERRGNPLSKTSFRSLECVSEVENRPNARPRPRMVRHFDQSESN